MYFRNFLRKPQCFATGGFRRTGSWNGGKMEGVQVTLASGGVSREKKKGIPGSTIKMIAVAAMLIDHIAAAILTRMLLTGDYYEVMTSGSMARVTEWLSENWLLYYGTQFLRLVGRLGFPIFCFLLVEGFQRTRNVKKYALRLALFALLSEVPFDLAFSGTFFNAAYQNVYFTLFIGLLVLWAVDAIGKRELPKAVGVIGALAGIGLSVFYIGQVFWNFLVSFLSGFSTAAGMDLMNEQLLTGVLFVSLVLTAVTVLAIILICCVRKKHSFWKLGSYAAVLFAGMLLADLLKTDYSGMGVLTIVMMYAFRRNKLHSMLAGCITLTVMSLTEATAFFALIPVAKYNGERGLKMKYFFYAFYPVHLLLLWLVALAMGMGWVSAI